MERADGGPRESPERGFRSYPDGGEGQRAVSGQKPLPITIARRRQFYISQTHTEQDHMARALMFELSKVRAPGIRGRMVAHLRNIDEDLAQRWRRTWPQGATNCGRGGRPTRQDLKKSPALEHSHEWPGDVSKVEKLVCS